MTRDEKSALSHWFPAIEAAGLPVPKTTILTMPREASEELLNFLDYPELSHDAPNLVSFANDVATAAADLGLPAFLRTDHTSGKHEWRRTCYLARAKDALQHVIALAEYSSLVDMVGLPCTTWVVREYLPVQPVTTCPGYLDMPLSREFRFFVQDGETVCWHPYWGGRALQQGGAVLPEGFDREAFETPDDLAHLTDLANRAGAALGGAWSVDLLQTERGWYVTDMAEAHRSGHDDCPNDARFKAGLSEMTLSGLGAFEHAIDAAIEAA